MTTDGATWCWGSNAIGQLGATVPMGSCTSGGETWACSAEPVRVESAVRFAEVAVARSRSCARTADGVV